MVRLRKRISHNVKILDKIFDRAGLFEVFINATLIRFSANHLGFIWMVTSEFKDWLLLNLAGIHVSITHLKNIVGLAYLGNIIRRIGKGSTRHFGSTLSLVKMCVILNSWLLENIAVMVYLLETEHFLFLTVIEISEHAVIL